MTLRQEATMKVLFDFSDRMHEVKAYLQDNHPEFVEEFEKKFVDQYIGFKWDVLGKFKEVK